MDLPQENLTTIAISRKNHRLLSKLGTKGQSFDDVLTGVLNKATGSIQEKKNLRQSNFRVDRSETLAAEVADTQTALGGDCDHD